MVVGERENLNLPLVNRLQNLDPLGQVCAAVSTRAAAQFLWRTLLRKPAMLPRQLSASVEPLEHRTVTPTRYTFRYSEKPGF
jgi:hypothetical protein